MKCKETMSEHKRENMLCWTGSMEQLLFCCLPLLYISCPTEPFWDSCAAEAMVANIHSMQCLWRGRMGEFKLVVWILCRIREEFFLQ